MREGRRKKGKLRGKMKKILLLGILAAWLGMSAEFKPLTGKIDYGTINEEDGEQTATVYLVNTGSSPDMITRVRTTCGCTVAAYDEQVIQPGDTTWVEVTYNPDGRIGKFEKAVRITDSFKNTTTVAVSGFVKPSEKSVREMFPVEAGPLALSTDKIMMGDLLMDTSKHAFLEIYNNSDHPVTPLFVSDTEAVEVISDKKSLEPSDFETYGFYVRTKYADASGLNKFMLKLYPNGDPKEEPYPVEISVNIEEL